MSTRKRNGQGGKKPPINVTSEGDLAKADFSGLEALLLGIQRQQEGAGKEVRGAIFEAVQTSIAGSLPPIEPDTGRGVTHDLWVSVAQQLPMHDGLVEVWNTGIDQVEEAFFDTATKRWVSRNPLTVYMFGEITHWREKAAAEDLT